MPSALVLVGQTVPRSRSLALTVAPTIAEPVGSVTRPVIPALTSCASDGNEAAQSATKIDTNEILRFIRLPPVQISYELRLILRAERAKVNWRGRVAELA